MKNIVLIGFMGAGKTSTGRLLASRLGRPFIDIDRKIEKECKMTVKEIFSLCGEEYFRMKERNVIARVARYTNAVIATGGGVALQADSMRRLRENGIIISLTASVEVILERTGRRNTRPLLERPDREAFVARLLAERAKFYEAADLCVDTTDLSPHQVTEQIIAFLRRGGHLHGRG